MEKKNHNLNEKCALKSADSYTVVCESEVSVETVGLLLN